MPTNLPAEAQAKLAEYQSAKTIEEKIRALEEALSLIPDHKGTEKMRAQLKTTLAKLRRQLEKKKSVKVARHDYFAVRKEGAATIALLGATNSGKSTIIRMLTNARPEVGEYELTTTRPAPAMLRVEDVDVQIVELPAVISSSFEETPFASKSIAVARNSDLIALTIDCFNKPVQQLSQLIAMLRESGLYLGDKSFEISVEKKDSGGIRLVVFGSLQGTYEDLKNSLQEVGIKHAVVRISGEVSVDQVIEHLLHQPFYRKGVVVAGRADLADPETLENLRLASKNYGLPLVEVSLKNPSSYDLLKKTCYSLLDLIRVYTQKDKVVNRKPIVVRKGTTVGELASIIHKDFARNLRYARIWGPSVKIQGQQVGPDHVLQDCDVVELFI